MKSLMIDLAPLREVPDFRYLYAGHAITLLCIGVMVVACNSQIYAISGSSFQVGLINVTIAVAAFVFLILGGFLADRYDRRALLFWARAAFVPVNILLLLNTLSDEPRLWPIHLAASLSGATGGLSSPAFIAAIPALVGRQRLAATGALNAAATQFGTIIGPLMAAAMIARWGLAACYLFCAIGVSLTPLLILFMKPLRPEGRESQTPGLAGLKEAARFIRGNPVVGGVLLIDLAAVIFSMPFAVFPELGAGELGGGAETVGLLHSAFAAGALAAALTSGWMGKFKHTGMVLIGATLAWGVLVAGFGLAGNIPLAMVFLLGAGFAFTVAEILRGAWLQSIIPDAMMGRVSSLWMMQASLSPALGNAQVGFSARLFSPMAALVGGGLLSVLGTLAVAGWFRALSKASLTKPQE
ncbi:MFS transporter [Lacibacterium aquatile]|uniref:MFS transporter n=1 Tax=Lacibacterium aquatile TaxID=1168082 RepID=A0ABW5DWM3_9PROT